MFNSRRTVFNQAYSEALYDEYRRRLELRSGPISFPLAETPLFLSPDLRDSLAREARAIVAQLSSPANLEKQYRAIPEAVRAPGMDALPNTLQVDFALVENERGELEGRLVELQAFPSLYAIETLMAEAWRQTLSPVDGLNGDWTCFLGMSDVEAIDFMRRTILGDALPEETALVDIDPENQKTRPDFVATKALFDVDTVCVTKIKKEGRQLLREKNGTLVPIRRFYNRLVFDELDRKNVELPFSWRDELDLTWCSHPNWYWVWSKFSLPLLDHPWVPKARYLSDVDYAAEDLTRLVLKPLFSFSGGGVVLDVTTEILDAIPHEQRQHYLLQERFQYAEAIRAPDGAGVKAEVRVMLLRPPNAPELVPLICLVRLSRGKMLGVDFNQGLKWVGGSVGLWTR
jgi:hypothetical protein